jgi:hypothetical protein
MMIGAGFVFVDFRCKQELFGKGIIMLVRIDSRFTIY